MLAEAIFSFWVAIADGKIAAQVYVKGSERFCEQVKAGLLEEAKHMKFTYQTPCVDVEIWGTGDPIKRPERVKPQLNLDKGD